MKTLIIFSLFIATCFAHHPIHDILHELSKPEIEATITTTTIATTNETTTTTELPPLTSTSTSAEVSHEEHSSTKISEESKTEEKKKGRAMMLGMSMSKPPTMNKMTNKEMKRSPMRQRRATLVPVQMQLSSKNDTTKPVGRAMIMMDDMPKPAKIPKVLTPMTTKSDGLRMRRDTTNNNTTASIPLSEDKKLLNTSAPLEIKEVEKKPEILPTPVADFVKLNETKLNETTTAKPEEKSTDKPLEEIITTDKPIEPLNKTTTIIKEVHEQILPAKPDEHKHHKHGLLKHPEDCDEEEKKEKVKWSGLDKHKHHKHGELENPEDCDEDDKPIIRIFHFKIKLNDSEENKGEPGSDESNMNPGIETLTALIKDRLDADEIKKTENGTEPEPVKIISKRSADYGSNEQVRLVRVKPQRRSKPVALVRSSEDYNEDSAPVAIRSSSSGYGDSAPAQRSVQVQAVRSAPRRTQLRYAVRNSKPVQRVALVRSSSNYGNYEEESVPAPPPVVAPVTPVIVTGPAPGGYSSGGYTSGSYSSQSEDVPVAVAVSAPSNYGPAAPPTRSARPVQQVQQVQRVALVRSSRPSYESGASLFDEETRSDESNYGSPALEVQDIPEDDGYSSPSFDDTRSDEEEFSVEAPIRISSNRYKRSTGVKSSGHHSGSTNVVRSSSGYSGRAQVSRSSGYTSPAVRVAIRSSGYQGGRTGKSLDLSSGYATPVEVKSAEYTAPVEVKSTYSAPIEVKSYSVPVEVKSYSAPVEVKSAVYSAPVEIKTAEYVEAAPAIVSTRTVSNRYRRSTTKGSRAQTVTKSSGYTGNSAPTVVRSSGYSGSPTTVSIRSNSKRFRRSEPKTLDASKTNLPKRPSLMKPVGQVVPLQPEKKTQDDTKSETLTPSIE